MFFFASPENIKRIEALRKKYGYDMQILKAIEELNEFSTELVRFLLGSANRNELIHEFFDVVFLLQQIQYTLDITEEEATKHMEGIRRHIDDLLA